MAVDGWLTGLELDRPIRSRDELFRRCSPPDLLRRLFRHARPWPNALTEVMHKWSAGAVETLLLRLEETGADMEQLARQCPAAAQRLAELPQAEPVRQIWLGEQEIQERAGRWYLIRGLRREAVLLLDGLLRLDRVVRHGTATQGFGRLLLDDEVLAFTCDVAVGISPGSRRDRHCCGPWRTSHLRRSSGGSSCCWQNWTLRCLVPSGFAPFAPSRSWSG